MSGKSELFSGWTWECRKIPKPYSEDKYRTCTSHVSKYNTAVKRYKKSTLHPILTKAIICYVENEQEKNEDECKFALGYSSNEMLSMVEYMSQNGDVHLCVYDREKGNFYAAIHDGKGIKYRYEFKEGKNVGTVLFLALLSTAFNNAEFVDAYKSFKDYHLSENINAVGQLHILNDNIYRRINNPNVENRECINVSMNKGDSPIFLDKGYLSKDEFKVSQTIIGRFKHFKTKTKKTRRKSKINKEEFIGRYVIDNSRKLCDEERTLIPELPDWLVIPREAYMMCKHIKHTSNTNSPMRNFMLAGPAGTGKTETAKAIAAGLDLPYMYFTCSANTEICDLVGQILPEMEDDKKLYSYPKFEDIIMDPSSAYATLTGNYILGINNETVYEKLIESIERDVISKSSQRNYRFVKSPIIRAIESGYVVEIQEPSVISNPGVLVGLNGILDRSGIITLPNGKEIKRHPDSVIIITTNNDYSGCTEINQSIISRMHLILHSKLPNKNTVIERAEKISGFTDKKLIGQMYDVFERVKLRCEDMLITDGSVGFREFIKWVLSTQITEDVYESAILTLIASASNYEANREELINTCLMPVFEPSEL